MSQPTCQCSDLKVVKSDISSQTRRKILTQKRDAGSGGGQGRGVTSLPIFIKFSQKRKSSGRFGFFFFIIIIFFRVSELFPGFGVRQQNIYCTLWYISNEIVFPFHSRLQPPLLSWKESVSSRKIPFLPKSAATAETPQLPDLRLRWHHPWDLGEQGRWPWLDLAPAAVLIPLGHRPTPSITIPNSSDGSKEPLPLGVSPRPQQSPTPQNGLRTRHKLQPRQAWITGQQERAGGRRQDGEVAHPPLPAGAKGQRGQNREAGCPASCPTHSSFPYRFYRSAAGSNMATSH